jgi:hypothetical protein
MYVPKNGQIFVHAPDTTSLFSNVLNDGSIGSEKGAVVDFQGTKWENNSGSQMPDESAAGTGITGTGGTFRFLLSPYNSGTQYVLGGYNVSVKSGASFPNISIENSAGVGLEDLSDLQVRHNLNFRAGNLYLNGWNTVVGYQDPGTITGYSPRSFIVTGTTVEGGYLYRSAVTDADSTLMFPVGTYDSSYSPAAIQYHGTVPTDIHARVYDSVFAQTVSGITNDTSYVLKTWDMGEDVNGAGSTDVWLQHELNDEGILFPFFRDSSYISKYNTSGWDFVMPTGVANPGTFTTGGPLTDSYINHRLLSYGLGKTSFLSVSTEIYSSVPSAVDLIYFEAVRTTIRWVQTYWRTQMERNIKQFILYRRRQDETVYTPIDTVASQAVGGYSNSLLYYSFLDDDYYDNWTYYQLKIVGIDGRIFYSPVRKVPWFIEVDVTPNPSNGHFKIHIFGVHHELHFAVVDVTGRRLANYTIYHDDVVDINGLADGIYFIVFYDPTQNDAVITTKKVLVIR